MALDDAARMLHERLDEHAIEYMPEGAYHTHSDGDASMCGRWLATSYTESNNDVSFWGLTTDETAELIRTFDSMMMVKKHPWRIRRQSVD